MKSEDYKRKDTREELLVRIRDAAACIRKREDQLKTNNTRSWHMSCEVHWGWRWDFRTSIVHC